MSLNIWSRIQMATVHYNRGALSKEEYITVLGLLYEEVNHVTN